MKVFEITAAEAVDHWINRKVDWVKQIPHENQKREKSAMLVVEFRLYSSRIPEGSEVDIGEQESANDRTDEKENKIGAVFKKKCTSEKHPVKDPGQGFHDNGHRCSRNNEPKQFTAESHHFSISYKQIQTQQNKQREDIDLKLN